MKRLPNPELWSNCYLVKLSNTLTDVHQLDYSQRRKWLQEAKLQPKVRVVIYRTNTSQRGETSLSKPQDSDKREIMQSFISYQRTSVEMLRKGVRKARKRIRR